MLYTLKALGIYLTDKGKGLFERAGLKLSQDPTTGHDDTSAQEHDDSSSTLGEEGAEKEMMKRALGVNHGDGSVGVLVSHGDKVQILIADNAEGAAFYYVRVGK